MDSHENCYETYKTLIIWEVVKVEVYGRAFLSIDTPYYTLIILICRPIQKDFER